MSGIALPSAVPIKWAIFKKGTERIRLGIVTARLWYDAREEATQRYGLDRGDIEVEAVADVAKKEQPKPKRGETWQSATKRIAAMKAPTVSHGRGTTKR